MTRRMRESEGLIKFRARFARALCWLLLCRTQLALLPRVHIFPVLSRMAVEDRLLNCCRERDFSDDASASAAPSNTPPKSAV
jgi:hypothetical protein